MRHDLNPITNDTAIVGVVATIFAVVESSVGLVGVVIIIIVVSVGVDIVPTLVLLRLVLRS